MAGTMEPKFERGTLVITEYPERQYLEPTPRPPSPKHSTLKTEELEGVIQMIAGYHEQVAKLKEELAREKRKRYKAEQRCAKLDEWKKKSKRLSDRHSIK